MKLTNNEARVLHSQDWRPVHVSELKDYNKVRCVRLKLVKDYGPNPIVVFKFFIKYMLEPMEKDFDFFPSMTKRNYKTKIYKAVKEEGIFIEDLFENISFT
jgi:hypothetical protein